MPVLIIKGQKPNLNYQKEADDGANITPRLRKLGGMKPQTFSVSACPPPPKKNILRHERVELKYLLQTRLQPQTQ